MLFFNRQVLLVWCRIRCKNVMKWKKILRDHYRLSELEKCVHGDYLTHLFGRIIFWLIALLIINLINRHKHSLQMTLVSVRVSGKFLDDEG